jgi:hypothetical protein
MCGANWGCLRCAALRQTLLRAAASESERRLAWHLRRGWLQACWSALFLREAMARSAQSSEAISAEVTTRLKLGEKRERARTAGGTGPPRAPGLAGSTPSPACRLCCCVFFTPLPRGAEGVRLRWAARPLPCHACVHSIDAGISRCRGTHV